MFVISAEEQFSNAGENQVRRWLSGWKLDGKYPLGGFAAVGFDLVTQGGTRQVDAIVWTQTACFILEVKGLLSDRRLGTLSVDLNGGWTLDGEPADLCLAAGDRNPFQQATRAMYEIKNMIEATWVDSAVVVVTNKLKGTNNPAVSGLAFPQQPSAVHRSGRRIDYGGRFMHNPHRVVLAHDPGPLRSLLAAEAGRAVRWDARNVRAAAVALGVPDVPTELDLAAEFPVAAGAPNHPSLGNVESEPSDIRTSLNVKGIAAQQEPVVSITEVSDENKMLDGALRVDGSATVPGVQVDQCDVAAKLPAPLVMPPWEAGVVPPVIDWRRRWNQMRDCLAVFRRTARVVLKIVMVLALCLILVGTVSAGWKAVRSKLADSDSPSAPITAPVAFEAPMNNIACVIASDEVGNFVRCDVREYSYPVPPLPTDCGPDDYGHTVLLREGAPTMFGCADDFLVGRGFPISPYGQTASAGQFNCQIEESGITCRQKGGAMFRVSREVVEFG